VGDRVAKGELLVKLQQSALRAALTSARATLAHVTLMKQEADREMERAQELFDRALLSEHDRIVAEMSQAEAESRYRAARAAREAAQEALRQSEIHAPYDAIVLRREVAVGQHIQAGGDFRPLLKVAEAQRRLVRGWIAPAEIPNWPQGAEVTVRGKAGEVAATVAITGLEHKLSAGKPYISLDIYIEGDSLSIGEVVEVSRR
jgi:RND family efflux transporter MFP subunit